MTHLQMSLKGVNVEYVENLIFIKTIVNLQVKCREKNKIAEKSVFSLSNERSRADDP